MKNNFREYVHIEDLSETCGDDDTGMGISTNFINNEDSIVERRTETDLHQNNRNISITVDQMNASASADFYQKRDSLIEPIRE